jgi:hypothetical protein
MASGILQLSNGGTYIDRIVDEEEEVKVVHSSAA